jgi:hypothetical protein
VVLSCLRAAVGIVALAWVACSPKAPLGQVCDPADASFCTVWELACAVDGGVGRCEPPGEFQPCSPQLGCTGSQLRCSGPFAEAPPNYFCFQPCLATSDCTDPDAVCEVPGQPAGAFCVPSECGPGSGADGGSANGTVFFAPCDSLDAGDGTCIPYSFADAGTFGTCQGAGPAIDGGVCEVDRSGLAPLCEVGFGCAQPDPAAPGECAPLCDPFDAGGPRCPQGLVCEIETGFATGLCAPSP